MAVYAPIYKDTIWTYDTPFIQYRIESPQGNVILEGRADTRPDGTPPTIYVNRLCEPFLAQELNPAESGLTLQPAYREFYLYNDLNDALLETYGFLRMYSGDWAGEDKALSDPIKENVSKDMNLPFTVFKSDAGQIHIEAAPAIRNNFFNLITTALTVNYGGGTYRVEWLTDYYPVTEIYFGNSGGTIQNYERDLSGATVNFEISPSVTGRTYSVDIYYREPSNRLGTLQVTQTEAYFEPQSEVLYVSNTGGTYSVSYETSLPQSAITASIVGLPSASLQMGDGEAIITVPAMTILQDVDFSIVFKYNNETVGTAQGVLMAGGTYSGSTKVYISGIPQVINGTSKYGALYSSESGCTVTYSGRTAQASYLKVYSFEATFQDPNPPYGEKKYTIAEIRGTTSVRSGTSLDVIFSNERGTTAVTVETSVSSSNQRGYGHSGVLIRSTTSAFTYTFDEHFSAEHFNVDGSELVISQSFPGGYVYNYGYHYLDTYQRTGGGPYRSGGTYYVYITFPYNANSLTFIGGSTATGDIMNSVSAITCDGIRIELSSANTSFEEIIFSSVTEEQFYAMRTIEGTVWESVMPVPYKFAPYGHKILKNEHPVDIKTSDGATITIPTQ